ncbi:MAG TPA: protein kinase [Polyangiaceae bacterium]
MNTASSSPSSSSTRIGSTLRGKWTLEKLLGEGGMASVYVARHTIGRLDAIKILHPALAATPQLRARFEQEARVVNRFRHRGAVEVRDMDTTEDGAPFIVMELLEGETLSALARRTGGPLDVATVLQIADEVLDVLAAAHAQGIIHRDIKPDNLLRLADGHIKVLDFGIARVREGLGEGMKTRTGTTLGTVAYMPPEQAKGIDIDGRADVYAVGATMFRLLAGRRVHEADTEAERFVKVVSEPAPPLASAAPHASAQVCAVVDRALAFDRERRYADATTMQTDVRAAARGEAPLHTSAPTKAAPAVAALAPERSLTPAPVEVPTRAERAPRPAAPMEAATRIAPDLRSQVPTVAGQVASVPAMFPTAATRAVTPPVATATPPVEARPPHRQFRTGIAIAVAAAALLALVLVAFLVLGGAGSSVTPAPSALSSAGSTGEPLTTGSPPAAAPTQRTTVSPAPAPMPPAPPGKHGHGR